MKSFSMRRPRSVAEAAELATTTVAAAMAGTASGAVVKAGGLDVVDLMKDEVLEVAQLVSLAGLAELRAVTREAGGGLRIGAMVTLDELARHPDVQAGYPALARAAAASASPQIRHVATLGGNLLQRPRCWYFRAPQFHCLRKGGGHCFALQGENAYHAIFDNRPCAIVHPSSVATALVAWRATVELADPQGGLRRLPLEDFFVPVERDVQRENDLRPQEILTFLSLPAPASQGGSAHSRLSQKGAFDWPLVDAAVALELAPDGVCRAASIVLGAVAPTPHRARGAEEALIGRHVGEAEAAAAARAAVQEATPLAHNGYKITLAQTAVRRALLEAAAGPVASPVRPDSRPFVSPS